MFAKAETTGKQSIEYNKAGEYKITGENNLER